MRQIYFLPFCLHQQNLLIQIYRKSIWITLGDLLMKLITWDIEEAIKIFETEEVNNADILWAFVQFCIVLWFRFGVLLIWTLNVEIRVRKIDARWCIAVCCQTLKSWLDLLSLARSFRSLLELCHVFYWKSFSFQSTESMERHKNFHLPSVRNFSAFSCCILFMCHLMIHNGIIGWWGNSISTIKVVISVRIYGEWGEQRDFMIVCFLQYWRTREYSGCLIVKAIGRWRAGYRSMES